MPVFRVTFYATGWSLEQGFSVQFFKMRSVKRMYSFAYKTFKKCYPKEAKLPFCVFFEDLRWWF